MITTTWLILEIVAAGFCSMCIWSRYPTKLRLISVLVLLVTAPVTAATLIVNSGWAVTPIRYLADLPADGDILGLKLEPDVAIYLMLDVDGVPRVFKLPWSNSKASQLQRLVEAQDGSGGPLKARKGQKADGSDTTFHEEPQPPAPEKQAEQPGMQYQRDAG